MTKISILTTLEIAIAFAGVSLFAACAISYGRVINALSSHLNNEILDALRPTPNWLLRALLLDFPDPPPEFFNEWRLSYLILGLRVLDHSDDRCRKLVSLARRRLLLCLILFLGGIIWVSWIFRNAA